MPEPGRRRGVWTRGALAVVAAAGVLVVGAIAAGVAATLPAGPIRITVSDYRKPLMWGAGAATLLLALGRSTPGWRRAAAALLCALGLLGLVAWARAASPIVTDADFAVGELYVELAGEGRLLVGPYSRFGWHHPGPLYFYLAAPAYALAGRHAAVLFALAVAINAAAIVTALWGLARERAGRTAGLLLALACLSLAWRAPTLMASPWTAHVPVLPALAFLAVASVVAAGRMSLTPLVVLLGSFAAQTHVAFVPIVIATTLTSLVLCAAGPSVDRRALRQAVNRGAWLTVLLWLPSISEAMAESGGNAASLWRFFVADATPGRSFGEAARIWSYGLAGVLRPDFALAWGAHFELTSLGWAMPLAIVQMIALAAIAIRGFTKGHRLDACLATIAGVASFTSLWAVTRIRGDVLNHDVFRLAALGAFNLAVIAAAALRVAVAREGAGRMMATRLWSAAAVLTVALTAATGLRQLEQMTAFERRHGNTAAPNAYAAIRDYLDAEGVRRPLIRIGEDRWGDAAGILLGLTKDGRSAAVDERWLPMFSGAFAPTGAEDAVITLADLELHRALRSQPGTAVLFESHPLFVDATTAR